MKILLYTWEAEYTIHDVIEGLNSLGHQLTLIKYHIFGKDKSHNEELYSTIKYALNKEKFNAVFSINYFPDVARACNEYDTIYISWTYDCPLDIEDIEETLILPTNRAFFFDRAEVVAFNSKGINTAYHMPLAVNCNRLDKLSPSDKFASEISFIGRVYHSSFPTLAKYLDDYYIGYLKGTIEAQKKTYGAYISKDSFSDSLLEEINQNFKKHNCPYTMDNKCVTRKQLGYSLATEATFENRLLILGLLSRKFDLKWYTTKDSESLPDIKRCPPVDYYNEMPIVFKSSKINLHIGLHSIPSGISLRQLDILGSGGFLLSSFQPELFDYFVPGEDFDYFTCAEEAYEKSAFYLSNEDTRKQIATSGYHKVNKIFSYEQLLTEIIEVSFLH